MSRVSKQGVSSAIATAALSICASAAMAQENFTWNGGAGTGEDWELSTNWTGGSGFASQYPGDLALDSANLNVNLGANLGVVIDAKSIALNNLTLGAADGAFSTSIGGGAGITLTASTIATLGAAGATNSIDLDFVMPNGNVDFLAGSTNGLTLNGALINKAPVASTYRDLRNSSGGQTLTINGDVTLSDTVGTAGWLRFQNDATSTVTDINGVITDGAAASGRVQYVRGTFHIRQANTYTGETQMGVNSPNAASTLILYTDSPFGTGRLVSTGQTAVKTLEGATGSGTRTLGNEIQLSRPIRFAGSESFVLNGQVYQANSTTLTNDITGVGKTLTINGNLFTANSSDNRTLTIDGSGTTIVTSVIDDTTSGAANGSLRKNGTGRLILTNPAVAAYAGSTEVFNGTLQLGTGGAAVNVPATVLGGGSSTTGTLEINHDAAMTLGATPNYQLNINHVGTGTTTLAGTSFTSAGTVNVDAGTLLINGGNHAARVVGGALKLNGRQLQVDTTAGLIVGQPLAVSTDNGGGLTVPAGTYITSILNGNIIEVNNTMGGTSGAATNEVTFRAGTGSGSSNVIVDAGATVGGNGTIGGLLGVNGTVAPGASIGTLTANGNAVINGTLLAEYDATGGGSSDLLDVLGSLTLGAASTLDLDALAGPPDDAAYVIASYGSLTGTFGTILDLPAGYSINYAYNNGVNSNNIAVVVPEPASIGALACAGLGLLGIRRRHSA